MDHYAEYLRTLQLVRKAQRRGDPVTAERWAKVAKRYFDARRWSEEMDKAEAEASKRAADAVRAAEEHRENERRRFEQRFPNRSLLLDKVTG